MNSILKTLFLCLCVIANTHFAYSQTASILPQGKTQFLDNNGKPLTSGTINFYIPSTTTPKTTWRDSAETIPNTNPVVLDAGGRAIIYGDGVYRMVVKDRLGNLIYDQLTSSTGSGSTSPTSTGDGDLVGTIKPWAGMIAPNQYMFSYGQEISRTTYSALYAAMTSSQPTFCNSGSPTLTGLADTNNFWIGMSVELSCVAAGFTTIISKTSTTVTMAVNANVTTNTIAKFYPWGRGNGTTTFNLPDLRGVVLAGNNIMGGVSSSNLTTTFFGSTDPNSSGAFGGNQSHAWILAEIPGHNHPVFLNDPGHVHTATATGTVIGNPGGLGLTTAVAANTGSSTTGTTIRDTSGLFGNTNQTNLVGGGIAVSATLGNTGSGYTNGSQTITISGGTCTTQPQFTVTIAGNVFTGTPSLLTAGSCTVAPANPAATTGGGGTGGTLNVTYSAQPVSLIQPTVTTNYIIKVTPDSNSATASGVTSLGLMTGDIACGTGLSCTGNIISVSSTNLTVGSSVILSGVNTRVLFDNNGVLGEYSISGTGNVAMTTSPTFVTPTLGAASATSLTSSTPIGIASGGTNGGTALVARSSTGLNIDQMTTHGDSIYTILSTDRVVATSATFTASRAWTLPAANSINSGQTITVLDLFGGVTGANTLVITRAGSDTINGTTTAVIAAANGGYICTSDGTSKWSCQSTGAASAGGVTSITPGGGLVSSTTTSCSQSAITSSGTLSSASCLNAQTGTSYAIADGDRGKLITASNTAAQAYSIAQAGASSNFQNGWYADIQNITATSNPAGIVTITPTTSTINGASTYKLYPGMSGRLISDGTNYLFFPVNPGQWQLLNTVTASASASVDDTTSITAQYNEYEIVLEQILPATNNVTLQIRVNVGGFQSTNYLASVNNANGSAVASQSLTTGIQLGAVTAVPNTAPGMNGRFLLSNPGQTLTCKLLYGDYTYISTTTILGVASGCYNGGSGAITGIQVIASSGNITSGKMKVYGRN